MRTTVLLCGTNYGRSYLAAIGLRPKAYELTGVLALGSTRSVALARQQRVPLFRNVSELPEGIDIACVALPGSASGVVLRLLEHNIHVLCEHPRRTAFLQAAWRVAAAQKVCFHLNGHFADLASAGAFIAESRRLCLAAPPCFLDVMTTDRALYGALDIVRRALGNLGTWRSLPVPERGRDRPFMVLIRGQLGNVAATFQVQTSWGRAAGRRPLPDGSPGYLLDYRITLGFPAGILSLLSIAGPVIWNANYSRSAAGAYLWRSVYADAALTGPWLERDRTRANRAALDALVRHVGKGVAPPEQTPQHLREVSRLWEIMGRSLGAPRP